MPVRRALLLFPFRPAEATRALRGRAAPLLALLPGPLAVGGYLLLVGCRPGDAAATGATVGLLAAGLGLGGAVGAMPALLLLRRTARPPLGACVLFGNWWVALFFCLLALARLLGAGSSAALAVGFLLLVWGIVAGIGLLTEGEKAETDRVLVASCLGAAGAVFGLLAAGLFVQAHLVMFMPAPIETHGISPGDPMLVRHDENPGEGDLVVVRDQASPEVFLATIGPGGLPRPVGGDKDLWERGTWRPVGRIFFAFTTEDGGAPIRRKDR